MSHDSNNFSENSKINDNTPYNTLRNIHFRNPINLKYMSYKSPKNGKNISSGKNIARGEKPVSGNQTWTETTFDHNLIKDQLEYL